MIFERVLAAPQRAGLLWPVRAGGVGRSCRVAAVLLAGALISGAASGDAPRVRAVYVEVGPVIDGVLDDAVWANAQIIHDFVQVLPVPGAEPTRVTEVRVLRDSRNLYVAFRVYENSRDDIVAHRIERDDFFFYDDHVSMSIDPFRDRLNGYFFQINPYGGRREVSFEGDLFEKEWNGIWYVETRIDDEGWTVEFALPFQSISFDPDLDEWGINFGRSMARTNEDLRWVNPRPDQFMNDMTDTGILEGMSGADQGIGLDVISSASVTRVDGRDPFDPSFPDNSSRHYTKFQPSLDAFYKVTPSLTASLTVNTDFGETEVDQLAVNLTRFALFFPEKRDFFLQDAGIFEFGELNMQSGSGSTSAASTQANGLPFFSRRIGIASDGSTVGILAGGKVTGRAGRFKIGLLDVETDSTHEVGRRNLGVVRVAANILEESTVGIIATRGDPDGNAGDALVGADFFYRNSDFLPDRSLTGTFWVQRSLNQGGGNKQWAYGGEIAYPNDRIHWKIGTRTLQKAFDPKLGFVNRVGIRQYEGLFRHRVRTDGVFRTFDSSVDALLVTDPSNELESATVSLMPLGVATDLRGIAFPRYVQRFERLDGPFEISPGVVIPPGKYHFQQGVLGIGFSPMREFRPGFVLTGGSFYGGTLLSYKFGFEWRPSHQFFLKANYTENRVDLPEGDFVQRLLEVHIDFHYNSNIAWNNLIQYDNVREIMAINSRFRWIIVEGRELFLVFNQVYFAGQGRLRLEVTEPIVKLGWTLRF